MGGPQELLRAVQDCFLDLLMDRQMQLVRHRKLRDHVLVVLSLSGFLPSHERQQIYDMLWDFSALHCALRHGDKKLKYLQHLKSLTVTVIDICKDAEACLGPAKHCVVDIVSKVGNQFFPQRGKRYLDYKDRRKQHSTLLKPRWQLRQ